jgi:aspartokinase
MPRTSSPGRGARHSLQDEFWAYQTASGRPSQVPEIRVSQAPQHETFASLRLPCVFARNRETNATPIIQSSPGILQPRMDANLPQPQPPLQIAETAFEKRRGISSVEVRAGFAQVHVSRLAGPVMENRLLVLGAVAEAGVSIDFLKLTQSGLSFVVPGEYAESVSTALVQLGFHFSIRENRHILLVHAVNMRDEEGLIATILLESISSGIQVDHVSDMHDRMLMVVGAEDAPRLKARIEERMMGVAVAH